MKSTMKNRSAKKPLVPAGFISEFFQILKDEIAFVLHKLFQSLENKLGAVFP